MNRLTCCNVIAGSIIQLCLLTACAPDPKPPEPTINPHPHEFSKLKIWVQPGFGIDNVEVSSTWQIGNIGCAPLRPLSGATAQKIVYTNERVEKLDPNDYLVTILNDRFLPDNCKWGNFVLDIKFMHGTKVLSYGGASNPVFHNINGDFAHSNILELTCESKSADPSFIAICWPKSREAFLKSHNRYPFHVTVVVEN